MPNRIAIALLIIGAGIVLFRARILARRADKAGEDCMSIWPLDEEY